MKFEVGVRVEVRGRVRVRDGVRVKHCLSQFARNHVNAINLLLAIYTIT